jgi:hypothetical protein
MEKIRKYIKNYRKFLETLEVNLSDDILNVFNLKESLSLSDGDFFNSLSADRLDIYNELNLPKDFDTSIENLDRSPYFFNSLNSLGLEKTSLENSEDLETFLIKPFKFFLIYKIPSNILLNPEYIIFQNLDSQTQIWRLKSDIKNFYDKLTSKTIELVLNDDKWIYTTSNGNDWKLQNIDKSNDDFKIEMTRYEIEELLKLDKIKLNIK